MDGAQWHAGLGDYIYNVEKYKKIATIAEDYAFTYTQVMGLTVEYCKAGGQITKRIWVPLGTKDFSSFISRCPEDVDAIYLGLGGADAVNFLNQYQQAGGNAKLIGGSIMVDQTVLSSKGKAKDVADRYASRQRWPTPTRPEMAGVRESLSADAEGRLLQESVRQPVASGDQLLQLGGRHVQALDEVKGDSATATRNSARR